MSDLRSKLERLGDRVTPASDAMERLARRRARRERTTRIATVVFALGIAAAGSFGAYAAFYEPKSVQAIGIGGSPSLVPGIGTITCDGTTTTVETPEVAAQADGVHLRLENSGTEDLGIQFEATGRGDNAAVGTSNLLVPIPPGDERVRCFGPDDDTGAPGGWQTITVTDPSGFYASAELECADGQVGTGIGDYVPGAKGDPDPAVAAADYFADQMGSGDEVITAGYPEDPAERMFVLRSDGAAIASVSYQPDGQDGWLQAMTSNCA
ncbi:MAG TPA: hypothetical protein VGR41_03990 [Actinomycetota bacterium]|jgi:hypothetical protein|nr:hypothetical protein [Actinomycetota bacterium]